MALPLGLSDDFGQLSHGYLLVCSVEANPGILGVAIQSIAPHVALGLHPLAVDEATASVDELFHGFDVGGNLPAQRSTSDRHMPTRLLEIWWI